MSAHEFTEGVSDGSMCICGVPALTHHLVQVPVPAPTYQPGDVAIATVRGAEGVTVIRAQNEFGGPGVAWRSGVLVQGTDWHSSAAVTITSRAVVVTEAELWHLLNQVDSVHEGIIREWFAAKLGGGQ